MSRNAKLSNKGKVHARLQQIDHQVSAGKSDGSVSAKRKRLVTRDTVTGEIIFSKNPVPLSEWMKGTNSTD